VIQRLGGSFRYFLDISKLRSETIREEITRREASEKKPFDNRISNTPIKPRRWQKRIPQARRLEPKGYRIVTSTNPAEAIVKKKRAARPRICSHML